MSNMRELIEGLEGVLNEGSVVKNRKHAEKMIKAGAKDAEIIAALVKMGATRDQADFYLKRAKLQTEDDEVDTDVDPIEEAMGEQAIDKMVKYMVEAPQFVKILKANEKNISSPANLDEDLSEAIKNALVLTLMKHDAALSSALAGQAKRDTKKTVAAV